MALKVVALGWANQPMLAVNRKLGYVPEPGFFIYHKHLK